MCAWPCPRPRCAAPTDDSRAQTAEVPCGGATTSLADAELAMLCTLYRDASRASAFEAKESTVVVQLATTKRKATLCRGSIDLSAHAGVTPVSTSLEVPLFREAGAMVPVGTLKVTVASRWLQNYREPSTRGAGGGRDDGVSVGSASSRGDGYGSDASLPSAGSGGGAGGLGEGDSDAGSDAGDGTPAPRSARAKFAALGGGSSSGSSSSFSVALGGLVRAASFGRRGSTSAAQQAATAAATATPSADAGEVLKARQEADAARAQLAELQERLGSVGEVLDQERRDHAEQVAALKAREDELLEERAALHEAAAAAAHVAALARKALSSDGAPAADGATTAETIGALREELDRVRSVADGLRAQLQAERDQADDGREALEEARAQAARASARAEELEREKASAEGHAPSATAPGSGEDAHEAGDQGERELVAHLRAECEQLRRRAEGAATSESAARARAEVSERSADRLRAQLSATIELLHSFGANCLSVAAGQGPASASADRVRTLLDRATMSTLPPPPVEGEALSPEAAAESAEATRAARAFCADELHGHARAANAAGDYAAAAACFEASFVLQPTMPRLLSTANMILKCPGGGHTALSIYDHVLDLGDVPPDAPGSPKSLLPNGNVSANAKERAMALRKKGEAEAALRTLAESAAAAMESSSARVALDEGKAVDAAVANGAALRQLHAALMAENAQLRRYARRQVGRCATMRHGA